MATALYYRGCISSTTTFTATVLDSTSLTPESHPYESRNVARIAPQTPTPTLPNAIRTTQVQITSLSLCLPTYPTTTLHSSADHGASSPSMMQSFYWYLESKVFCTRKTDRKHRQGKRTREDRETRTHVTGQPLQRYPPPAIPYPTYSVSPSFSCVIVQVSRFD